MIITRSRPQDLWSVAYLNHLIILLATCQVYSRDEDITHIAIVSITTSMTTNYIHNFIGTPRKVGTLLRLYDGEWWSVKELFDLMWFDSLYFHLLIMPCDLCQLSFTNQSWHKLQSMISTFSENLNIQYKFVFAFIIAYVPNFQFF